MLHFEIVGGCQLRCVGCPNSTLLPKIKQIELESFSTCLSNINVQYVHTLRLFNFGEPLLHRQFSRILEIIAAKDWQVENVEISTNAQHVYWDDFERALRLGVLNRIVVSCDGDATPESYERLRPPSKWTKLMDFLERTRSLRDQHCPQLALSTRSVVENRKDADAWEALLHPMGWETEFRTWQVLPEAEQNRTGREVVVPQDICTFVAPSDRFTHDYHGELNQLYVDWDGTVVPCCAHPRAGEFGNLHTMRYDEILNGTARTQFLDTMENNRQSMRICGQCEYGPPENPGPSFFNAVPEEG